MEIMKSTKTEDSLYIKILLWAYKKQESGFTQQEMFDDIKIAENKKMWILNMFFSSAQGERPLIGHQISKEGKDYYSLTEKGMAASIDYMELKEAQAGGERATKIAIISIMIGVIVGITQIIVQICFK